MQVPGRFPPFGANQTHGPQVLANEAMVAFTIKLGIGQDAGNGGAVSRLLQQRRQECLIVTRAQSSIIVTRAQSSNLR
jgi:hypothetical protein